jgi:hypothetical protein
LNPFVPVDGTFYPRANEIIAFCLPSFPMDVVPLGELDMIKSSKRTIQEWATLFKGFLVRDVNQDPPVKSLRQMGFSTVVPLKTPSRSLGPLGAFDRFPYYTPEGIRSLLVAKDKDEDDWNDILSSQRLPQDVVNLLKAMKDFMLDFENWWKQPFTDSNIVLNSVQEDLHTIKQTCETLSLMLGNPVEIGEMSFPDAWLAISYAATYFTLSPELDLINSKLIQLQEVVAATQYTQTELAKVNKSIDKFEQ